RRGKEAHQPPPESEYIPFAVIERHIFFGYPTFNGGLHILVMWHEYVMCSKYGEVLAESSLALISQFIDVVPKTTTLFDGRVSVAPRFSKRALTFFIITHCLTADLKEFIFNIWCPGSGVFIGPISMSTVIRVRIYQWHAIRIFRHNNRVMIPPVIPLKIITNNISRLKLLCRFHRFPLQTLSRSAKIPSHGVCNRPTAAPVAMTLPPPLFARRRSTHRRAPSKQTLGYVIGTTNSKCFEFGVTAIPPTLGVFYRSQPIISKTLLLPIPLRMVDKFR